MPIVSITGCTDIENNYDPTWAFSSEFTKTIKVILSCKTLGQLNAAKKYAELFYRVIGRESKVIHGYIRLQSEYLNKQ